VTAEPDGTSGARPAGRYGERRTSRAGLLVIAATCLALLGWLVWAALAAATPDVRSTLISYDVIDERQVQVRFSVTADKDASVVCRLEAAAASGEVVGLTEVELEPGPRELRQLATKFATRSRAATVTVAGCRVRAQD